MVDSRHKTKIELEVDDRQVRGLDKTLSDAFDDRDVKEFDTAIEKSSQNVRKLTQNLEHLGRVQERNRQQARNNRGGAAGGGGGLGFGGTVGATAIGTALGRMGGRVNQVGGALGQGEGFISQALGGIPWIGGLLSGALNQSRQLYGEFAQQQQAIATASSTLGRRSLGGAGNLFTAFGMDRGQAMQRAAQLAQAGGISGDEASPEFLEQALRMQMLGGIQNAPSVVRAMTTAGGSSRDAAQAMTDAVSAGIAGGFRDARLGEFLQVAASTLEQARRSGADVRVASILQLQRGFAQAGASFQGAAGAQSVSELTGGLRNMQIGNNFASQIALRAAGFGEEGVSYSDALLRLQSNPEQMLPAIIRQLRQASGGNVEATRSLLRQVAPALGLNLSEQQVRDLAGGELGGFDPNEYVGGEADEFLARRGELAEGFRTPATEAQYRNRRAGIGGAVARSVVSVRSAELSLMAEVLPTVAGGINEMVGQLTRLVEIFQAEGASGLMTHVMQGMLDSLSEGMGLNPEELAAAREEIVENPMGVLEQTVDGLIDMARGAISPGGIPEEERATQRGFSEQPTGPTSSITPMGGDPRSAAEFHLRQAADAINMLDTMGEGTAAV